MNKDDIQIIQIILVTIANIFYEPNAISNGFNDYFTSIGPSSSSTSSSNISIVNGRMHDYVNTKHNKSITMLIQNITNL